MIQTGDVLGDMYQIIGEIGQGGTGVIYLAEHLRLQKKVVVKKIKDHFTEQVNGRAEVDILKRLHHTYLPQVYDFLMVGSSVYTVMEYVEGYDLQWYLDRGYQFPETMVQKWLFQLSEVLDYLHSQKPQILHSDIKPANLMVTPQWNMCLIDFNISLDGEHSKGIQGISPWYAAPEQYEKAQNRIYGKKDKIELDGRMDIYSLGATFYRVMTGHLPAPEREVQDIAAMDIPYSDGIKAIVSKAMKRHPSARFQTARQMHRALEDTGKMDPVYRRYGRIQIVGIFGWLLCVIAGVTCLYYGSWLNGAEKWQQAYQELYKSAEAQEETAIVSKATEMLNEYQYQGYLKKDEKAHAEVLHTLGESYFRQEKFTEAAECYKDAWDLQPDAGGYCRDYVISLVRSGQISKAGQVLRSAEGLQDLSKEEQRLIQAEIAWMEKDKETALSELEQLKDAAQENEDIFIRACLLQAEIYQNEEDYEHAVLAIEEAKDRRSSKEILRYLGQTAAEAARESEREVTRNRYLQKALNCYESLNQSEQASYYDRLNYALIQRAAERYKNSNDTLLAMAQLYPEDYKITMWICYNTIDLGALKGDEQEAQTLEFRYNDCIRSYQASGKKDEDMEELIRIMEEAEEAR